MKKIFGKKKRFGNGTKIGVTALAVALVTAATVNSGSIKNLHGEEIFSFNFGERFSAIQPAAGDGFGNPDDAVEQPGVSEGWGAGDNAYNPSDSDDDGVDENVDLNKEYDTGRTDCGSYPEWIGQKVDPKAVEATGKPFRILGPGSVMTMDHSYDRITVVHDSDKIVVAVTCS